MVTFKVTSAQDCTIGGIGALTAGETITLTEEQLNHFEVVHGYPLSESNFPPHVQVVAFVDGKEV